MALDTSLSNITQPDTDWDNYAQDQLEHEDRDNRNLLIAARVLHYLRETGRSKSWLAEQMNLSRQRVGEILKGRGNMTLESVRQLERATGLTLLEVPAEKTVPIQTERKTSWHGRITLRAQYVAANLLAPHPQDTAPVC